MATITTITRTKLAVIDSLNIKQLPQIVSWLDQAIALGLKLCGVKHSKA